MWKRLAIMAALCGGACMAHANEAGQCRAPVPPGNVLTHREETISRMEQLSETCLKVLMVQCSESANMQLLDLGSAAMCSMGYEALLRKGFGGSFVAMMMWWKGERAEREFAP